MGILVYSHLLGTILILSLTKFYYHNIEQITSAEKSSWRVVALSWIPSRHEQSAVGLRIYTVGFARHLLSDLAIIAGPPKVVALGVAYFQMDLSSVVQDAQDPASGGDSGASAIKTCFENVGGKLIVRSRRK